MQQEPNFPIYCGDRIRWTYIKKYLPKTEGGNLLDAGAGNLQYKPLAEYKGYKYFGIDNDPNSPADKGDLCALPYKDRMFDVILCIDVMEHIKDDVKAVRELFRVLKPEGKLILHVPNKNQKHILIEPEEQHDHVRHGYTPASILALVSPEFRDCKSYATFNQAEAICWDLTYAGMHNKPLNPIDILTKVEGVDWINYGWVAICKKSEE